MANTPDLQDVLAKLKQYSQPPNASNAAPSAPIAGDDLDNASASTAPPRPQSIIDPATITQWQAGLRCVTSIAGQNKDFADRIRRMMREQRAQEMQWYQQRNALKRTQARRDQSSAQATAILSKLNPNAPNTEPASAVDNELELQRFDRETYAAQSKFEAAATLELKRLGIPFFGTPAELIVQDAESVVHSDNRPKYSQPVTKSELRALQQRMIKHLEDLYGE